MTRKSDILKYVTKVNESDVNEPKNTNIKQSDTLSEKNIQPWTSKGSENKIALITSCGCIINLFWKSGFGNTCIYLPIPVARNHKTSGLEIWEVLKHYTKSYTLTRQYLGIDRFCFI